MTKKDIIIKDLTCWVITEGMAGTENQCLGIAESLGVTPVVKKIKLRFPWKQLTPILKYSPLYALSNDGDKLEPPWPDLILASGRKAITAGWAIKKRNPKKTFLVQIQDPRTNPALFDLVVVPQHDITRGNNVHVTTCALHLLTPEKLNNEAQKFSHKLSHLPNERIAILIGGNSKAHQLTKARTKKLITQLLEFADAGFGLMVTASRRTGNENMEILQQKLSPHPNIYFWNGDGENPYFGFLGLAHYILVTNDSVSMTSEAISTGKPVYSIELEGGASRLNNFHQLLQEQGYTRKFEGQLEKWTYEPPNDTLGVAHAILKRIKHTRNIE